MKTAEKVRLVLSQLVELGLATAALSCHRTFDTVLRARTDGVQDIARAHVRELWRTAREDSESEEGLLVHGCTGSVREG